MAFSRSSESAATRRRRAHRTAPNASHSTISFGSVQSWTLSQGGSNRSWVLAVSSGGRSEFALSVLGSAEGKGVVVRCSCLSSPGRLPDVSATGPLTRCTRVATAPAGVTPQQGHQSIRSDAAQGAARQAGCRLGVRQAVRPPPPFPLAFIPRVPCPRTIPHHPLFQIFRNQPLEAASAHSSTRFPSAGFSKWWRAPTTDSRS